MAVPLAKCLVPACCRLHRLGPILVTQFEMEETMAVRSVAWDTGEAIHGTYFRHMIKTADTGGRFSTLSAVLGPASWTFLTHTETKTNLISCSEGASAVV